MSRYKAAQGNAERGSVLIELVLIIPFTILVALLSLEVSRYLQLIQVATSISKEAASLAYRDCAGDPQPKLRHCLNLVRAHISGWSGGSFPDREIIVSVYEFDPIATQMRTGVSDSSSHSSRYAWNGSVIAGQEGEPSLSASFHQSQRVLAIGEVFIKHEPLIPFAWRMLFRTEEYYHATVL